ncbi:MAG: hypothetical protein M1812_006869 [Candelaria pacifica]|nr:MAG: hypothetical protein M1812_006869 [Candelaria pacifica]
MGNNGGGAYHRWTPEEIRHVLRSRDIARRTWEQIVSEFLQSWGFHKLSKDSVVGVYKKYKTDVRYMGPDYTPLDTTPPTMKTPSTANMIVSSGAAIEAGSGIAGFHRTDPSIAGPSTATPSSNGRASSSLAGSGHDSNNYFNPHHYQPAITYNNTGQSHYNLIGENGMPVVIGFDHNGNPVFESFEDMEEDEMYDW